MCLVSLNTLLVGLVLSSDVTMTRVLSPDVLTSWHCTPAGGGLDDLGNDTRCAPESLRCTSTHDSFPIETAQHHTGQLDT